MDSPSKVPAILMWDNNKTMNLRGGGERMEIERNFIQTGGG